MSEKATGEMPFLEHLEELRVRILRSLGAVIGGMVLGIFIVDRYALLTVLKQPIAKYLPNGQLTVLGVTEPIMIELKMGMIVGLVLASPIILWQVWEFLSPALYAKEKKALVPALFAGLLLFLLGGVLSFIFLVPRAIDVLLSFQKGQFATMITFNEYFSFVMQVVLAMGLSFELPLIIILLVALGIITPAMLHKFRRYEIVLAFIAGAVLSPGTDVLSMFMMTIPLLFLYEVGVAGAVLVYRRRLRRSAVTAALLLLGFLAPRQLSAQRPGQPPPRPPITRPIPGRPPGRFPGDSLRDSTRSAGSRLDSLSAKRLGIPTAPKQQFASPDSIMSELLDLEGYEVTRYLGDTATVFAPQKRIELHKNAMMDHTGSVMEADVISYEERNCTFNASGEPHMFDKSGVVIGDTLRYDTCVSRGVVIGGQTTVSETGANWIVRGHIAVDSNSTRTYVASSNMTSCDLPNPHYHFFAKEVKFISQTVMVARPVVLYIRDVPILWLPFIFQDTKPGRHSGILIPQFGINDIVRPQPTYNRQVTNAGYYWAPSEYFDIASHVNWYANRKFDLSVAGQYRWINRFINGNISYTKSLEIGREALTGAAGNGYSIDWNHQQRFDITTSLNLSLHYNNNTRLVQRNSLNPFQVTSTARSALNFQKQFAWGTVAVGGSRDQSFSDNSTHLSFPSLTISPKPVDIGTGATWSPNLSITNDRSSGSPDLAGTILIPRAGGGIDTVKATLASRVSSLQLQTPLRIGSFNWANSISVNDQQNTRREVVTYKIPDPKHPGDSITVSRVVGGDFQTAVDWDTGINLPILFRNSWKLTPTMGITNASSAGAFALRNNRTGGSFVRQGKRLQFTLSTSPTLFGMLPGFGPYLKIRHSIAPSFSFQYAPGSSISQEYARAVAQPGQVVKLTTDTRKTLNFGLNQVFEAKERPAPGDTMPRNARKVRLLSISTSGFSYDFEQAKQPHRTGWTTSSMTNTFQTDLLRQFTFSVTHDLWRGQVGTDTAKFEPFLSSLNAGFTLSSATFRSIGALLGLTKEAPKDNRPPVGQFDPNENDFGAAQQTGMPYGPYGVSGMQGRGGGGREFTAQLNFTLSRPRPIPIVTGPLGSAGGRATSSAGTSQVKLSTAFSPTQFWSLSWNTLYDLKKSRFQDQLISLTRDLHEWRASFNFAKTATGNFTLFFSVYLIDLPPLKFDYNQSTINR